MNGERMEENQSRETVKPQPKAAPMQIAAIALSSVAIVAVGVMFFTRGKEEEKPVSPAVQKIGMEANIVTNEDDANVDMGEPTTITTWYQRDIYITNGTEATCMIGNAAANYYEDMYIQIYLNDENDGLAEELYVSQIIPRGSHIESFTANRKLEPGDYRGTLIYSQLNEAGELVGDTMFIVEIHVS